MGVPVVCDADDCFFAFVTDEFDLVFDFQHRLPIFHTPHAPDFALHRPWIPLLHVLTHIPKHDPLLAMSIHRLRPFEILLAPPMQSSMQAIGPVICSEVVGLAIQIVQLCIFDPVSRAADCLAKVGRVVRLVQVRFGEAEHDVVACDAEFLDDGALGEEGKC